MPSVPAQETLVRRFRAVAARFGDRLAVHGPSGAWTYRELDARSDALAARIRAVAGRGERVALLYGHDIKVVAAVLAVLKAAPPTCRWTRSSPPRSWPPPSPAPIRR